MTLVPGCSSSGTATFVGMGRLRMLIACLAVAVLAVLVVPPPSAGAAVVSLGTYHRTGLVPVDGASLLYAGSPTPRVDSGTHDSAGVRMALRDGRLYNHPVGQAQYGLLNVSTYLLSHDAFYLNRAVAQANRLVATRVVSGRIPARPSSA